MAATVIVQQYFTTKRALATGLASSGLSVGVITAGPIIQQLLDVYSWRGTIILVAGLWLHVLVFGALFRPLPQFSPQGLSDHNLNRSTHKCNVESCQHINKEKTNRRHAFSGFFMRYSLFCNPRLVLFGLGNLFLELGLLTFYHHTPGRAIHFGIERHKVALLPTIVGISESCGRLIFGFVANQGRVNRTLMFGVGVTVAGIILMCYSLITSYVQFAVYCSLMGIVYGNNYIQYN